MGRKNNPWSLKPGFRARLTGEGYEQALESAEDMLDLDGFVTENKDGLTVVEFPKGGYLTVAGCNFFVEAAFNDNGLQEDYREGNHFWVAYSGVVNIEGLNADEFWQNWSFTQRGEPI
jgi:hypothetical protein